MQNCLLAHLLLIQVVMKKFIYSLKIILKQIRKDYDVYMVIRKYNKSARNPHYLMMFAFILISLFSLVGICYAAHSKLTFIVPEPTATVIVSTGVVGWLIRFANKRFQEFKRILDIFSASIGLIILSPVMLFMAIFVKIVSPGPAFFKQERVGLEGKLFYIYKLRTMRVDAEKDTGPMWARKDDPRLIKFGKAIRKLHLDELPQLYNVIKGDMSIVGPRPERPVFVEKLCEEILDYKKRIQVRPGITGLAQVHHKYDETIADVRKKVKYDLLYIREMRFSVDMGILARTVIVSARGKGAH